MADLPDLPALFLSHSGEQKGFVQSLYRELLHVNHNPFFDQDTRPDSLPKGTPFPSRILDACRACKLGVVVLSHDYLESMWPMLELQELFFHNPSSPNNVYPIFYKLKPADLCKTENLKRWKSTWEQKVPSWHAKNRDWQAAASSNSTLLMLDMDRWPDAVRMLSHQSGDIFPDNKDEHAFIQAIVSNICKRFPAPESFLMGDHFKGAEHIQEEINELFQKQQHGDQEVDDSQQTPIAVGIYGVGGSGKTTVCRYMLNVYNKEYPGNCCFLQFPSKEADRSLLVQSLKDVLSKRGDLHETTLRGIQSVEEAMPRIQEMLKRFRVFLIVDNVWNWSLDIAIAFVKMHFIPGSRLLVTARSEDLLQTLSTQGFLIHEGRRNLPVVLQIVHVPSISEEEAIEALKAYSLSSLQYFSNIEGLRGLARSCFYGKQCHPLLLKAVGTKLRYLGGQAHSAQDWTRVISNLQARLCGDEEIEDMIVDVLKTGYDVLHPKLQYTFLKLGTCVPREVKTQRSLSQSAEWLSKLSDDGSHTIEDIRAQLMELKFHGLIQIHGEYEDVVIHDIQMMLIEKLVRENKGAPRCFFFEGDTRTKSASECTRLRYIFGDVEEGMLSSINLEEGMLSSIFCPQDSDTSLKWLKTMIGCFEWLKTMIGGFPRPDQRASNQRCPPNIEVLHLRGPSFDFPSSCERLSSITVKHMQSLRHLHLSDLDDLIEVGGWHGAPNLVSVEVVWCERLRKIESMTSLHSLRVLDLCGSARLEGMEGSLCGLTALEELNLRSCSKLKSLPDLKQLVRLRKLVLWGCEALREVKLGDAALTSLEWLSFDYGGCHLYSTSSCSSPLAISAFTNLHTLQAQKSSQLHEGMDAGSIEVPVSLEVLSLYHFKTESLYHFKTEQEVTGLSALVNLRGLMIYGWDSVRSITGLGGLTKLSKLTIFDCDSLREVGHWEPPFTRYNLQHLDIFRCPQLETLSTITHLPSLTRLRIDDATLGEKELLFEDMEEHFTKTRESEYFTAYSRR